MKLITNTGMFRVPFEFQNKTAILNVTRYTTFNDVVHVLTHATGVSTPNARQFGVFECARDFQRKIGGEVRVLAIWRSWGSGANSIRFVVKQCDGNNSCSSFVGTPTAKVRNISSRQDTTPTSEATMSNSRNVKSRTNSMGFETDRSSLKNNRCASLANMAFHLDKTSPHTIDTRGVPRQAEIGGKGALLARYLDDLKMFTKRRPQKPSRELGQRSRADGAEVPEVCKGRYVEGSESNSVQTRRVPSCFRKTSMAHCRYNWDNYSGSDTDSDISENFFNDKSATYDDTESDVSSTCSMSREVLALDVAFVKSSILSESDEGIDVTSMTSSDLNTAFVAMDTEECRHAADGEHSAAHTSTVVVGEFENNMSTCAYVRDMFGAGESERSHDDNLDSFMRSTLESF